MSEELQAEIERLRKANFQLREGAEEQQQRMNYLRKEIFEQNQEIEQTCGNVLGYPWFKDDQKNFLGATEKDGVCVGDHVAETIVSELASRYTEALARIKRLEEAGDAMAAIIGPPGSAHWADENQVDAAWNNWRKAKEAKP